MSLNAMKNPKHLEVVLNYLESGDIEKSYMKVYPNAAPASAYTLGHRILRTPEAKAIRETYILRSIDESKIILNQRRIVEEMASVAFGSKRLTQKVPALKAMGDWAGLNIGADKLMVYQKEKLEKAMIEFRSTFNADDIIISATTKGELQDYLEAYDVDYPEKLNKKELLELLKMTVKKYRATKEYRDFISPPRATENEESE